MSGSIERLHNINEVRCPHCREYAGNMHITVPGNMILRFEVDRRVYYVHEKCVRALVEDWLRKYGPKTDG